MTTVTSIRRSRNATGEPEILTEDKAREAISQDMRMAAGVPADWWREDREVLVATHNRELAAQAADELARRDFGGRGGYLSLVRTGASIEGPIRVVLVGEVGGVKGKDLDIRPAGPAAPYVLYVCLVRPFEPQHVRGRAAELDSALDWENTQEDAGLLAADDRRTCRPCQTWASDAHLASPAHQAATRRPGGRAR